MSYFKRAARYAAYALLGVVALVVLAAATVGLAGGRKLATSFQASAHPVPATTDPAEIAEGGRLAGFWGCTGCHRADAGGGVFFTSPLGDRIVAPNLTRIVHEYSDQELEAAIRHGVRPDGSSVVIMPSAMFTNVSDEDLARVIGYLRSLPQIEPDTIPTRRLGLGVRFFALTMDEPLEAARMDPTAPHPGSPEPLVPASTREDTLALGRYLAHTGCTECHGLDLRGRSGMPDLRIAAAYSLDQFRELVATGRGLDGLEKGLMSEIATGRINRLNEGEIIALHTYLETLAD